MAPSSCVSLFVCLLGGAASAATYPVSARLEMAQRLNQHCLKVTGGERTDCSVLEEAHKSFGTTVAQMFETREKPDLELVLTVEDAEIFESVEGGLTFDVLARVRVQSPDGQVLDEFRANGRVAVTDATAVDASAAAASQQAARDFAVQYARSDAISSYLAHKGVATPMALTIGPRSRDLVSFGLGFGAVQGGGDGGGLSLSPEIRLSTSWNWVSAQIVLSHYTSSFQGITASTVPVGVHQLPLNLHTTDLGFEAGPALRLAPWLDLHFGPGVHYLFGETAVDGGEGGDETSPISYSLLAPSAFASLTASFRPYRNGVRFDAGIEGRAYFSTPIERLDVARRVPVANASLLFFLGGELPWSSDRGATP